jgi:hypothetical protein
MARRIEYPSRVVTKVRLEDERIMDVMAVKRSVGRVSPCAVEAGSSIVPGCQAEFCINRGMLGVLCRLRNRLRSRMRNGGADRVPVPVVVPIDNVPDLLRERLRDAPLKAATASLSNVPPLVTTVSVVCV